MKPSQSSGLVALSLLMLPACSGEVLPAIGGNFAGTKHYQRKQPGASQVEIYLEGEPPPSCTLQRVGLATYNDHNESPQPAYANWRVVTLSSALAGFKLYLSSLGVDGAVDVVCPPQGTTGFGTCTGTAYTCE